MNEWKGYTVDSSKEFLLNAGAFYKNATFDETTGVFSGTRLGATQGGGEFSALPEIRSIEVDGASIHTKGLKVIDDWEITLKSNLMEVTKDNFQAALGASDIDASSNAEYDIINLRRNLKDTDYIDNIAWVGRKSDNTPVIILIENALNSEGLAVTMAPKAEGVIPITFTANADPAQEDDLLPARIYIKKTV